MNDRFNKLRVRSKYFNIKLFSVHAPTGEKEVEIKDAFHDKLEEVYNITPRNDMKIILGNLNAKIGQEEEFTPYICKESMHNESNENGLKATVSSIRANMKISSAISQIK